MDLSHHVFLFLFVCQTHVALASAYGHAVDSRVESCRFLVNYWQSWCIVRSEAMCVCISRRLGNFLFFLLMTGSWIHSCVFSHQGICPVSNICGNLRFQFVDFISQISYDIFVRWYVLGDHFFVGLNAHFDVFGPVRILQSVDRLLILGRRWGACCNHDCFAIATKRVLEHPSQLTVSEWNEETFFGLVTQGIDTVGEGQERCIDLGSFSQPNSSIFSDVASLWTREVDQR